MFTNLYLANFKAFGRMQSIPTRPITLIYGPNSGGKSSLIHGLLWAHHVISTGETDAHYTKIGGEAVDLGGFRQFIHRRDLLNKVEWGVEIDSSLLQGKTRFFFDKHRKISIILSFGILPESSTDVFIIHSYEIKIGGRKLLKIENESGKKLRLVQLDLNHEELKIPLEGMIQALTTTNKVTEDDYSFICNIAQKLCDSIVIECSGFLPRIIFRKESIGMLMPIGKDTRGQDIEQAMKILLPQLLGNIVNDIADYTLNIMEHLQYLGPLRSYPQRHLIFDKPSDPNWFSGGEYAWDIVRKDKGVRDKINEWLENNDKLQTPYKLIVRELISQNFNDELGEGILPLNDGGISELLLIDKRSKTLVSHRDVGVGISQILPVLVSAYANNKHLIAIEQPELHLHPALQSELADVFIESALGEKRNTFLLETHSEHLILRIMRRIRETTENNLPEGVPPIQPKDVSIIYVQPRGDSSVARKINLDEEGRLIDPWPGGFFEEGFFERFL